MAEVEEPQEVPAAEDGGALSPPAYLKEVTDMNFVNISIKGYEKKTSTGFPKEEYYGYRVVSILTTSEVTSPEDLASQKEGKVRQEVWRRYSEFETLRMFLCTAFPHIVIPPLPEKSSIRGSSGLLNKLTFTGEDSDFLLRRQQALEIFLVRISRHPILSKNIWFHEFLKLIGWREALQRTGYTTTKAESLFQTLSLQLSKSKPDSRFQDVKDYADDMDSTFKSLLEMRERLNESLKTVYKVHTNYGRVFSEWSEMEDTLGTPLQIAGGCMDSYAESIDTYEGEEELRYLLPLKEYIAYCDSLRAVVRRQELLQKQAEKAEETLAAKVEAKQALEKDGSDSGGGSRFSLRAVATRLRGGDTSYEGRLNQASKEQAEADDAAKQAQQDLETFTKDAVEDLERFSAQRVADFRSLLINIVQLQLHMHRKGLNTWERVKQGFEILDQ